VYATSTVFGTGYLGAILTSDQENNQQVKLYATQTQEASAKCDFKLCHGSLDETGSRQKSKGHSGQQRISSHQCQARLQDGQGQPHNRNRQSQQRVRHVSFPS